jgi:glycine/D-amino acid oxidase-like deaminating enzyme
MINNEFTILGAGIQGICIALELAKQGKEVIILDQDTTPFNRASLRNEGKIHLGIVYINDLSFETPTLMLKAALQFRKSLERWIGQDSYNLGLSNPFHYLVAKDSFLSTDEIKKRYAILENHFKEYKSNHPNWDYLGTKPEALTKQISNSNAEALFGNQIVQGAFETPELSIDTEQLGKLLTNAVAQNPLITFLPGYRVTHLQREGEKLKIKGKKEGSSFSLLSKRVINAT